MGEEETITSDSTSTLGARNSSVRTALVLAAIALMLQVIRPLLHLWSISARLHVSEWFIYAHDSSFGHVASAVFAVFALPIVLAFGMVLLVRSPRVIAGGIILSLAILQALVILQHIFEISGFGFSAWAKVDLRYWIWFALSLATSALLSASAYFCLRKAP